jgi:chromo domain-containing protein 1
MSKVDFRKLCERNIAKFEATLNGQQEVSSLEAALVEREAADSSQLNHLFADSLTTDDAGLIVRQPSKARKPPVGQSKSSSPSSSYSSQGEASDDSLMAEIATTSKKTKRTSTAAEGSNTERRPIRNSAHSSRTSLKRAATTPNPSSVTKSSLTKPAQSKESRRPSLPQADPGPRNEQMGTVSAQQKASNTGGLTNAAAGNASAAHNTILPGSTSSGTANRAVSFATQPSTSKTTSGPGKSSGIRIVNEPKPQLRQAPALPKKSLFQTLHRRGVADKRSRREGTPDVAALNFINTPPDTVISNLQARRSDPYARREPSNRRIIAEEPRDDEPLRQESIDGNTPLEPWEIHKVPQVCYQWRLSNNCTKIARECRFMHRHKDEKGHDYTVADMQGWIPGKYRRPPLTCPFWLNGPKGCKNSTKDCQFAHENTGWIKHSDPSMSDARIDPDQRPKHDSVECQFGVKRTTGFLKPDQLTCWYWNKGQCRKSEQDCAYQHKDTGILADGPHEGHQKPVPIPDVDADMDIDDTVQPHMTDETTRIPSPLPPEQPEQIPPPPPPITNEVKIKCEQLRTIGGSVCALNFEDMFASNDGEKAVNLLENRAFLMYHPDDHFEELEIITRWLLLHHVQVVSTIYPGAWAVFKEQILQGGSGIIIVCSSHIVEQADANYTRHIRTLSTLQRFQISANFFGRTCVSGRSGFSQVPNTTLL